MFNMPKARLRFYDEEFKMKCIASDDEDFLCDATHIMYGEFMILYQVLDYQVTLATQSSKQSLTRNVCKIAQNYPHERTLFNGIVSLCIAVSAFRNSIAHIVHRPHDLIKAHNNAKVSSTLDGKNTDILTKSQNYLNNKFKLNIGNQLLNSLCRWNSEYNADFIGKINQGRRDFLTSIINGLKGIEEILELISYRLQPIENEIGSKFLTFNQDTKKMVFLVKAQ